MMEKYVWFYLNNNFRVLFENLKLCNFFNIENNGIVIKIIILINKIIIEQLVIVI